MKEPLEPLAFANREQWRAWLELNHGTQCEAWLIHTKKGVKPGGLAYEEAVEEALCFGWIDGLLRGLDAERFLLRYSPRRRGSVWSESNRQRVARLVRQGRMAQAGLQKVREAQESGEWDAAGTREDAGALPTDLEEALRSREGAWEAFRALPPSHKKQYLWWIAEAKREETRLRRILATVDRVLEPRQA